MKRNVPLPLTQSLALTDDQCTYLVAFNSASVSYWEIETRNGEFSYASEGNGQHSLSFWRGQLATWPVS